MCADIWKTMGQRAFGTGPGKRPAATPTEASRPAKKPAAPTNGPSTRQQPTPPPATAPAPAPDAATTTPPRDETLPPPFFIEVSTEWPALAKELITIIPDDFRAVSRGKFFRVRTSTTENFRKVQRYLLAKKVPFHTYTLGGGRNLKAVLNGLPSYVTQEQVLDALAERKFSVEQACRLRNRRGPTNRWLITFTRDEERDDGDAKAGEIWLLRELFHVGVTATSYKRPAGPPQCYHCQGFGHGSSNCGRPKRCVRCGEGHDRHNCQTPYDQRKCCNCGKKHQANYRGCEQFFKAKAAAAPWPSKRLPEKKREPVTRRENGAAAAEAPGTDDAETSTDEDGYKTVGKRRRRRPRNPENRGKKFAAAPKPTEEETTAKRPALQRTAKASAPAPAPRPNTARPAPSSQPTTDEQPTPVAAAPATAELREVHAALAELARAVREIVSLIHALANKIGQ